MPLDGYHSVKPGRGSMRKTVLTTREAGLASPAMNERKLKAWVEAGIIDSEAAARIRVWEESHSRPLTLWAVIGIGALAIGLGIVLVVAANWDDIPAMVRLGIHLALLAALLGALAWFGDRLAERQPWGQEALLFVIGALGLTFLPHLGQAYQTTSPLWQPLLTWLVLLGPLLLLRGQSWLIAAAVMAGTVAAALSFAAGSRDELTGDWSYPTAIGSAFVTSLPVLAVGLGAIMRRFSDREAFWRRIEQLGLSYGVLMVSFMAVIATDGGVSDRISQFSASVLTVRAAVLAAAAGLVLALHRAASGRAAAGVLGGSAAVVMLLAGAQGHAVPPAILFILLWTGIAAAATYAGWRVTFQFAVAAVALRLIVLSFELDDDLLGSGLGLIVSGVLILGIAGAAVVIARRFAPPREPQP